MQVRRQKDGILSVREFKQIAGRAGRKGFDERGWVVAQAPAHVVEEPAPAGQGRRRQEGAHAEAPAEGVRALRQRHFRSLGRGHARGRWSRAFAVSHGLLLTLLQGEQGDPRRGGGYRKLLEVIASCHDSDVMKRPPPPNRRRLLPDLRRAGLVNLVVDEKARCPQAVASSELQHDFSLHHTLSLYLVGHPAIARSGGRDLRL